MTRHLFLRRWATPQRWVRRHGQATRGNWPLVTTGTWSVGPPDQHLRLIHGLASLLARSAAAAAAAVAALSAPAPEGGPRRDDRLLRYRDLVLDLDTREVRRGPEQITLTKMEFRLLELFLRHPHQVLTREVIFDRVWGFGYALSSNTLNVYIGYLRRKTEAGDRPRLIHTVRGVGYVLRADPAPNGARRRI